MGAYCFTRDSLHLKPAEKIASLSKIKYNDPMSLLSTIYPYILREYARINQTDILNVDEDELFEGLDEDWDYDGNDWKEFCLPYVKAINNIKNVEFENVRSIVNHRLTDKELYISLLEKYNLNNNNITDSNGNELLYEDLKIQLLAKIFDNKINKEQAEDLGYKKVSKAKLDSNTNDSDSDRDEYTLQDEEPEQSSNESVFDISITMKPLNLQIDDSKFKLSSIEKTAAINTIANTFMNYIDRYVGKFDAAVKKYASDKNISINRAKWEISRNNDNLNRRIQRELKAENPDYNFINKWKSQIIPLNEAEIVDLYGAKSIAKNEYEYFKSKPEYSVVAENFDYLFIEAASIINNVYNINILGDSSLYDNFSDSENEDDPSTSNSQEDNDKDDYSRSDNKTKSSESSLTKKIKRAYTKCYDLKNNQHPISLNTFISAAHNKVLHLTQGMIDKDDLIPMLSKSKEEWIHRFIDMISNDDNLFKQLYRVIKLSAQDYRIIYYDKKFKDIRQKSINMEDMSKIIKSETVSNIDNGLIQGDKGLSLYNKNGYIDKSNIDTFGNFITSIRKDLNDGKDVESNIKEAFRDIGITLPLTFDFKESVSVNTNENKSEKRVINEVLEKLFKIKDDALKRSKESNNAKLNVEDDSSYKWIYNFISNSAIGYIESCTNEQGKSYYTYIKTNYLDELILKIKRSVVGKKDKNGNDYYESFLNKQFGSSEFFYDSQNKAWRSDWMSKLFDNNPIGNEYRRIFKRADVLHNQGTEYLDWNDDQVLYSNLIMYQQGESFTSLPKGEKAAWYRMPIASDSPAGDYIRFISYIGDDYKNIIFNKLWDLCKQELVRMNDVEEHLNKVINNTATVDSIDSYDAKYKDGSLVDAGGLIFTLMPQLNYIKINTSDYKIFSGKQDLIDKFNGGNFIDAIKHLENKKIDLGLTEKDLRDFFIEVYESWFNEDIAKEFKQAESLLNVLYEKKSIEEKFELWENFSLNSQFAFTQMVQLTSTDLAFFGDRKVEKTNKENSNFSYNGEYYKIISDTALDKFQKRNKEYHAPTNKIATNKEYYREVYVSDYEIPSQIQEAAINIIKNNNLLDSTEKKRIIDMYSGNVNVADGQAYRSLSSYKQLIKDFGEMDKETEAAFDRIIKTHEWDLGDLSLITLAIKPYMYDVIPTERDTNKLDGSQNNISVPTQHKNSEYPILAALGAISLELKDSIPLRALEKFMSKHQIDVIQFESAVKVGITGVSNVNWNASSPDYIVYDLEKYCGFDVNEDGIPTRVHKISTAAWGEQTKKPEHLIDKQQLVGSQPRRLILADIPDTNPDGSPYTIKVSSREEPYTKDEFVKHYQELITQNILDDFRKVDKIFSDPVKLSEFLREQVCSSNKYDNDMIDMFTWNIEENRFNIPFWDQSIANRVEELLNGLIRNRISKQKMRGGSAVQTAAVGLTKKLNVRYQDENGEVKDTFEEYLKKNPEASKEDYRRYLGNTRLAYMECLLPMWSKDLMEALTNERGLVNFKKLPKSLREIIGYRIPTEDHYSMAPLKVVGFVPTMGASSIVLPADITLIAGSDFDIDVMYLLLKEFTVNRLNIEKALDKYNSEVVDSKKVKGLLKDISDKLENNYELYYDGDKYLGDNVNNILDDKEVSFSTWLNRHEEEFLLPREDWKIKVVKYDTSKTEAQNSRKARNNEIIDCMYACLTSKHSIEKFTNPGNYKETKRASRICECLKIRKDISVNKIINSTTKELELFIDQAKSNKNIASPLTAVELHQQNATGVQLKAIFAAANAIQQFFEYAPVQSNIHFVINFNNSIRDDEQWKIGRLRNRQGTLITKNLASYLAAAVDNGKDPIMKELLINKDTANDVIYLTLLGYTPLEISLLMNCADSYKPKMVDEDSSEERKYKLNKEEDALSLEQMAWAIQNPDNEKGQAIAAHAKNMLKNINFASQVLSSFTQLMRADSVKGNVGKSLLDNVMFSVKYAKANFRNEKFDLPFSEFGNEAKAPTWPMLPYNLSKFKDNKSMYDHIKSSKIPFLQAFIDSTIKSSYKWFDPYSLITNYTIFDRIYNLTNDNGYVSEKVIKKYLSDLECYALSQTEVFGEQEDVTLSEKKKYFIEKFPQEYAKFKKNVSGNLKNNIFLDNVIVVGPNKEDLHTHIEVKDLGLSKSIRDQFKTDFMQLAYEDSDMAQKLFVYTVFRDGLGYSQKGFSHLIPSSFKKAIPQYVDTLYSLKYISDDNDFFEQFVRNNYKVFPSLAPSMLLLSDADRKKAEERILQSDIGYNHTVGYCTIDDKLYKKVVHSESSDHDEYKLIELQPLGSGGKFYHDYDTHGGIKTMKESVNIEDIEREDDADKGTTIKEYIQPAEQIETEEAQSSSREKLQAPKNTIDDANNKQC